MKFKLRMTRMLLVLILVFAFIIPSANVSANFDTNTIRVNQIGYLPGADKIATIVNSSTTPLSWQLLNASTLVQVASGTTIVYGLDKASNDYVHKANFTNYSTPGTYKLRLTGVGDSAVFDIKGSGLYPNLPKEAMEYFYFHRMGTDILAANLANPAHAHSAFHPGDVSVSCFNNWCGAGTKLNVQNSWADAGDFGIYPVNHAIAAWTLLNLFERIPTTFPDGSLNIPEKANAIPDIVDEVRFGSNFMKGMLPPTGLASHKVTNDQWSGFPTDPSAENALARYAQPPSTNATYAVARNMAQLARVINPNNATDAAALWNVAKDAWSRAEANPNVAYTASTVDSVGGGDYADSTISDDRYAAACEMYLTAYKLLDANKTTYQAAVTGSTFYKTVGQFDWATVAPTGTISLISVTNDLPAADIATMKNNLTAHVDSLVNTLNGEGYPSPVSGVSGIYSWGSNSFLVNKMLFMGIAYDITANKTYLKSMHRSMDYLMGNNAMRLSYITGYGAFNESDTHDRWAWGKYLSNIAYPKGWLSGGPMNEIASGCDPSTPTSNPAAKGYAAAGTAPNAWCSKENTINWNAPLVWVASYMNLKEADLNAVVADTIAPTVPTGLAASNVASSSLALSWTASTDNIGVTGYNILRGGVKVGTSATTSYNDSGLAASTAYSYTVQAYDGAGNVSASSTALSVTTTAAPARTVIDDFEAGIVNWTVFKDATTTITPTSITTGVADGLKAMQVDYSIGSYGGVSYNFAVTQNWLSSSTFNFYLYGNNSANTIVMEISDNAGTGTGDTYERFLYQTTDNFSGWKLISVPFSSFVRRVDWQPAGAPNDGFTLTSIHGMSVYPKTGNSSFRVDTIYLTGGTPDTLAPTAPTGLAASSVTSSSLTLTWAASTDNVGVTGYDIYNGTTLTGSTTGATTFNVTGLTASTAYTFSVKAKDGAGNISAASAAVTVTTAAASSDTLAPTVPTNLAASSVTSSSLTLTWTASTDNVGVTGYDIYNGNALAGSTSGATTFNVTGLTASTAYTFTVKAKDAAGNVSASSTALSVTTTAQIANIALNKTATASNQCNNSETPVQAVDGSTSTKWCDNITAGDKWLKLDLGQSYAIARWVVKHAGAGGEGTVLNTSAFKLQQSSDGTNWVDVDSVTGNTLNITDRNVSQFTSRYVRLYITNWGGDSAARIYEFELYSTPAPVNLALNKPATADSSCNSSEGPEKAVDGTTAGGSKWCSQGTVGQYWLKVDLGASSSISKFIVKHAGSGGEASSYNTKAFTIQTSTDGTTWTTVVTVTANTLNESIHTITAVSARYVKLNITTPANDSNTAARIYEFEVYAN